ncbi:MAG TPA: anti-sigma regulatory factor [Micromonospora sp.]
MSQLTTQPHPTADNDVVLLTVPADSGYLGVLRTATAGLAARLQFTLDEIEDLRIAVDEACAMLLTIATPGSELDCRFTATETELTVDVTVPTAPDARLPATSSFAWKVLTALTTAVNATVEDGRAAIQLVRRRS